MDSESLQAIVAPLLEWYDRHARILPWRESPEPYRVWISEIMLQQTRVEAVKPYYDRFLKELPDLHALAEASEPQLLKLWEGLGYYNRVRNLQKAARVIVSEYGGEFPRDVETLRSLPGMREYYRPGDRVDLLQPAGAGGGRKCAAGGFAACREPGGYLQSQGQGGDFRCVAAGLSRRTLR